MRSRKILFGLLLVGLGLGTLWALSGEPAALAQERGVLVSGKWQFTSIVQNSPTTGGLQHYLLFIDSVGRGGTAFKGFVRNGHGGSGIAAITGTIEPTGVEQLPGSYVLEADYFSFIHLRLTVFPIDNNRASFVGSVHDGGAYTEVSGYADRR